MHSFWTESECYFFHDGKAAQQLRCKRFPPCVLLFFLFYLAFKRLTCRDYHHISQERRHEGITGAMDLIETVLISTEKWQTRKGMSLQQTTNSEQRQNVNDWKTGSSTCQVTSKLRVFHSEDIWRVTQQKRMMKSKCNGYNGWKNK